jgi:hypothetical protein
VSADPNRFHVELRSRHGLRRAWTFNLAEERLRREVVEPWLGGRVLVFGDRDWEPRESELVIYAGPELSGPDLGLGQGPAAVERTARNVTREVLGESAVERNGAEDAAIALVEELRALDGVSIDGDEALGVVAERLRELGLP